MPTVEELQARYDDVNKRASGSGAFLTLKSGKNTVRVLPGVTPEEWWYYEFLVHWRIGADDDVVICPRSVPFNQPCPICEYVQQLRDSDSTGNKAQIRALRAKSRVLYWAIDMAEMEKGIQQFETGITVLRDLMRYMLDAEYGDFTHLEQGREVHIEKTGTGEQTRYSVILRPSPTRAPDVAFGIPNQPVLSSLKAGDLKSYEDIAALMRGEVTTTPQQSVPAPASPPANSPPPPSAPVPMPPAGPQSAAPVLASAPPSVAPVPVSAPVPPTGPATVPVATPTPAPASGIKLPPNLPVQYHTCYGQRWNQMPDAEHPNNDCNECKFTTPCMQLWMETNG